MSCAQAHDRLWGREWVSTARFCFRCFPDSNGHSTIIVFVLSGLLADKLGSYVLPFQVAGGITLAGSFIPFMLLCDKRRGRPTSILQQEEIEGENLKGVAEH